MITRAQLEDIGSYVAEQNCSEQMLMPLRQQFPDIHFTWCMDDDVGSVSPVREFAGFNLYLVDSSNHCLSFTQDLQQASGVVVAEVEDD